MTANLQTALTCLNDWSSFLAFEKLTGPLSHCSRVYRAVCICSAFGLISAWSADASESDNRERTAQLLLDLNATGFKSIQLLGHCGPELVAEHHPARAFFVCYDNEKDGKEALLALCRLHNQPAVALSEHGQIRVVSAEGRVEKVFNKLTMTPAHLKKVWAAGRQLQTGDFTGSPKTHGSSQSHLGGLHRSRRICPA
jgi:hypothetical protein